MKTPSQQPASGVPGLDPAAAARWERLAPPASPWLHEEIARRMAERLEWFREPPTSWLHWEPVQGGIEAHQRLRQALPEATCLVHASDMERAIEATREPAKRSWNPTQWRRASQPAEAAPDQQVAMVWANMVLHHAPQPLPLLERWHSLVHVDGFLMFSCLGPDSLQELREVYAGLGWPAPAHNFTDMHDLGDMLIACGFAEPVMDMERIILSYSSAEAMLDELRGLGRNLNTNRFPGLRTRAWREHLCQTIETRAPRSEDGRLVLTFEVVYGHAYKPAPRAPVSTSQSVSLDEMRALLRSGRR